MGGEGASSSVRKENQELGRDSLARDFCLQPKPAPPPPTFLPRFTLLLLIEPAPRGIRPLISIYEIAGEISNL